MQRNLVLFLLSGQNVILIRKSKTDPWEGIECPYLEKEDTIYQTLAAYVQTLGITVLDKDIENFGTITQKTKAKDTLSFVFTSTEWKGNLILPEGYISNSFRSDMIPYREMNAGAIQWLPIILSRKKIVHITLCARCPYYHVKDIILN